MYKLPKRIEKVIESIEFADDLIDNCIGIAYLKDGYEFIDGSHSVAFTSKKDLISFIDAELEENPKLKIEFKDGVARFYRNDEVVEELTTVSEIENFIHNYGWDEVDYDVVWA